MTVLKLNYDRNGLKINDVFKPTISDAFAFVLNNRKSSDHEVKTVEVTLIHNWQLGNDLGINDYHFASERNTKLAGK